MMLTAPVTSIALAARLTQGSLQVDAVAEDPTDNKAVACTAEGQAGYEIAGDEPLLNLERYGHIAILSPRRSPDRPEDVQQSGT
jgi:predicted nucleic acid-binding protein